MTIAFIDAETTGLNENADPWEIGVIVRDHPNGYFNGEWLWQIRPDLTNAEPIGLRIGRFYERFVLDSSKFMPHTLAATLKSPNPGWVMGASKPDLVAYQICLLLDGATWVGAVPNFDELRIGRFVRRNGYCLTNHYHLIDIEAAAAGYIAGRKSLIPLLADGGHGELWEHPEYKYDPLPPWNSRELTAVIDVQQDEETTHTALGDARWAMEVFDAVFNKA